MTGTINEIIAFAESRRVCQPALDWLRTQPDPTTAWQVCEKPGWLIWWLKQQPATEHKTLVRIAFACDRTALRPVPQGEDRPRIAIETAADAAAAAARHRAKIQMCGFIRAIVRMDGVAI